MEYTVREARESDKELLVPWTTNTFAWGDYVVDYFDDWLAKADSRVLVAADENDAPVGVARGVLLSADELWLQGARVHPDWRRRGIASALGDRLQEWGAGLGARVALLMTEDWNEAARVQVTGIGFRQTSKWLRAFKPTRHSGRVHRGSSRRSSPPEPLQRVAQPEVGPAFVAWSGGELHRAGRGMMAVSWQWRRLHVEDLERAADHGALFAGPTGWAIAARRDQYLEVGWINTSPEHGTAHFDALLAVAVAEQAATLEIMMPEVPWLAEAAAGCEFELESLILYEKAL